MKHSDSATDVAFVDHTSSDSARGYHGATAEAAMTVPILSAPPILATPLVLIELSASQETDER
jgi:hypothetical protein